MKRKLLFVTSRDNDFDQDLSYALDLAKMTDRGMAILLVKKKNLADKFEKMMTAVTFAEAGEHDAAVEIMSQRDSKDEVTRMLEERCLASGMATAVYSAMRDATVSLKDFLKNDTGVDMVLLSPSVAGNGAISPKELKRLVRMAALPVVTMVKQTQTV
jgi:hypothetical protein